jgi:outer membrane immunogenic protein
LLNFGNSEVNLGWTVGAGLEGALVGNWNWKAEYLYMDLGSIGDPTEIEFLVAAALLSASKTEITTHTNFTDNIFRVGLNYQFH